MAHRLFNPILTRSWLRISLAVVLLVVGLAPIGVPILSENNRRLPQPGPETVSVAPAQPFMYRSTGGSDSSGRVQRSDDEGATWHEVASIPAPVQELVAVPGDEQVVYARTPQGLWVTQDAGESWTQTAPLPSRPVALAVTDETAGTLYVGTESMGLLRSNDRGHSWQSVDSQAFLTDGTAPLSVTALALNPEDGHIVYAAVGFWLGTSEARFTPLGVYTSVDGGTHWFEMSAAALGSAPVEKIEPVAGKPMAADVSDATGSHRVELGFGDTLKASLQDADPRVRSAAARVIGLVGDRAAAPLLLDQLKREPDTLAGEEIAGALGQLGDRSVIPALLETLTSADEAMQSRSAHALGLLGAEEAVPLLSSILETGKPMAQRSAATALATIGTPEAIAALQAPLANAQMTAARNASMIGLEAAGDRAVNSLTQALGAQSPVLRANAAEMLGWLQSERATPELSQALADSDAAVREQAAWALGEIGTPQARQALAQALRSETNAEVVNSLQATLARGATPVADRAGGPGWAAGLLSVLATIPLSKWAFMTLLTALAVFVLLAGSRHAQSQPRAPGM